MADDLEQGERCESADTADAALANLEIREGLEPRNLRRAICIPLSGNLDRIVAKLLLRPVERPAEMPLANYKGYRYQPPPQAVLRPGVHNRNSGYKEAHMTISLSVLSGRLAFLSAISLSLLVGVPSAAAQTSSSSSQEQVKVLAHLPLDNMQVNQMFVQQRDNKFYLYLHRPAKDAFALVDVSKPDKPVLLSRDAMNETPGSQVQPPAGGSVLALTVTPEGGTAHVVPAALKLPTETVQLVDMSNPKSAKSVKTFKGVTSVYPDDARKLVYLVNGDGLWIVSHRMIRPMPLCTSEQALTPLPECR